MASQNRLAALLFRSGTVSLLLLVGLIFGLYGLHEIGLINVWQVPLRPLAAFWVGGGITCLLGAAVLRQPRRWLWQAVLIAMIGMNGLGYLGAYVLTHASTAGQPIGFPRPENSTTPAAFDISYETRRIELAQDEWIEIWLSDVPQSQGSVLLFPGNKAAKDRLLAPAQAFHQMGYDIGLVDFRGVGGSSGHTTTVGAREAKDVVAAVEYLRQQADQPANAPLILYGVSMGSAAILKAVGQAQIQPSAIILELPFARLLNGVKTRLSAIGIPSFLTGELIVLWGSLQHGFNGFAHNPVNYAKGVDCPTLVLHGQHDKWTTQAEIDAIVANLKGQKQLVIFPEAGHQLLITVDKALWKNTIAQFLQGL